MYFCGAGFPTLATFGVLGYGFGYALKQWFTRYRANEDLAVWDYVRQHPEDFPELERKIAFQR